MATELNHLSWTVADWWSRSLTTLLYHAEIVVYNTGGYQWEITAEIFSGAVCIKSVLVLNSLPEPSVHTERFVLVTIEEDTPVSPDWLFSQPGFLVGMMGRRQHRGANAAESQSIAEQVCAEFTVKFTALLPSLMPLLCVNDSVSVDDRPLLADEALGYVSKGINVQVLRGGMRYEYAFSTIERFWTGNPENLEMPVFDAQVPIGVHNPVAVIGIDRLLTAVQDLSKRENHIHVTPESVRVREFPPEE